MVPHCDIVSTEYLLDGSANPVKTVYQLKFIKENGEESHVQRYEIDGTDSDFINEQLVLSVEEYNARP